MSERRLRLPAGLPLRAGSSCTCGCQPHREDHRTQLCNPGQHSRHSGESCHLGDELKGLVVFAAAVCHPHWAPDAGTRVSQHHLTGPLSWVQSGNKYACPLIPVRKSRPQLHTPKGLDEATCINESVLQGPGLSLSPPGRSSRAAGWLVLTGSVKSKDWSGSGV